MAEVDKIGWPMQWQDWHPLLEELHLVQVRIVILLSRHQNHLEELLKHELLSQFPQLLISTCWGGPENVHFWIPRWCCCCSENHSQNYSTKIESPLLGASLLAIRGQRPRSLTLGFILYSRDVHYMHLGKAWIASLLFGPYIVYVCVPKLLKYGFRYGPSYWL